MNTTTKYCSETIHAINDGFSYCIRPIAKNDKEKLIELFNQISPENRYLRFAHAISKLPDEFLQDVLELDYVMEMALVACLQNGDQNGAIIGIARYASDQNGNTCEFSISVSDQYSAHGVGVNLMGRLIEYAKQKKIQR